MSRQITPAGLALIKSAEGCRLTIYLDIGGVPTGGYGHTRGLTKERVGQAVTPAQADAWLMEDLLLTENGVESALAVPLNDNQFSALVCFTYNEGLGTLENSSLLREVNLGNFIEASADFAVYNKVRVDGKLAVSRGLTIRRHNEAALFLTPVELSAPPMIPTAPEDQTSAPAVAPAPSFWQRVRSWFS